MSSELTSERLKEIIDTACYGGEANIALTELLERRKAEECPTCLLGYRRGEDDVVIECPDCHGTGKNGNVPEFALIAARELEFLAPIVGEHDEIAASNLARIADSLRSCVEESVSAELIAALRGLQPFIEFTESPETEFEVAGNLIYTAVERAEGKRV